MEKGSYLNSSNLKSSMRRQTTILFLMILVFAPLIYAEEQSLPNVKMGDCINISQTCPQTKCSEVRLTQIARNNIEFFKINSSMDKRTDSNYYYEFCNTTNAGKYIATTCDAVTDDDVCVDFHFDVTLSGEKESPTAIVSDIILLIVLGFLVIFLHNKHSSTDFETWGDNLIKGHKHMGETMVKGFLKTIFQRSFIWVYFIGWLVVLVLKDIIFRFNSAEIFGYFTLIANIYSLGMLLVVVYMIGQFANFVKTTLNTLSDNNWGVGK